MKIFDKDKKQEFLNKKTQKTIILTFLFWSNQPVSISDVNNIGKFTLDLSKNQELIQNRNIQSKKVT